MHLTRLPNGRHRWVNGRHYISCIVHECHCHQWTEEDAYPSFRHTSHDIAQAIRRYDACRRCKWSLGTECYHLTWNQLSRWEDGGGGSNRRWQFYRSRRTTWWSAWTTQRLTTQWWLWQTQRRRRWRRGWNDCSSQRMPIARRRCWGCSREHGNVVGHWGTWLLLYFSICERSWWWKSSNVEIYFPRCLSTEITKRKFRCTQKDLNRYILVWAKRIK